MSGIIPANGAETDVNAGRTATVHASTPTQQADVFYYDATHGDLRRAYQLGSGAWSYETVDGDSTAGGRLNVDLGRGVSSVAYNGQLEAFYFDATHGDLRQAVLRAGIWRFKTIDGNTTLDGRVNGDVGRSPFALISGGQLNVFYYDATNGDLRHAWFASGAWHYETLDGNSTTSGRLNTDLGRSATAAIFDNQLHVFYYDYADTDLRHAWLDSGGWHFETLDGNSTVGGRVNGDVGQTPSALVYNGNVHVYYFDYDNGNLRHAFFDGHWHFAILDGNTFAGGRLNADVGQYPHAVDFNGTDELAYYDQSDGDLRWAAWAGGWAFQTLDGDSTAGGRINADVGQVSDIVVANNQLEIFYYDFSHGDLRWAWSRNGSLWHFSVLDGNSTSGGELHADVGLNVTALVS